MDDATKPFWERKTLEQMTDDEWESLCDGCAKCCLEKLEDPDTGVIEYTNVGCPLLDIETCRCKNYPQRQKRVPDCIRLTPATISELRWMPSTCAYRLLSEGRPLPDWHPLVSGQADGVHRAEMSVRGRVVSGDVPIGVEELEKYIVTWPE